MKKTILTIAIVLGLGMISFADPNGGGMFQRGNTNEEHRSASGYPILPQHNQNGNQPAPIGTGIAVLTAFGAAYLTAKRRKQE